MNSEIAEVGSTIRKGSLELAILAAFWKGRLYGLEILRRLENDSDLIVVEGTVYPLLSPIKPRLAGV